MDVYTQNLAPSWPELVSHRESITQWYHIPAYQAFISLYVCVIFPMLQLLAICVWLSIAWLPWPECWEVCRFTQTTEAQWYSCSATSKSLQRNYHMWHRYQQLNQIETPSASHYIITMFLLSPLRYQYPPGGGNSVTKIAPKSYQDLRYFLCINLLQFCQILSQIRVSHRNNN